MTEIIYNSSISCAVVVCHTSTLSYQTIIDDGHDDMTKSMTFIVQKLTECKLNIELQSQYDS